MYYNFEIKSDFVGISNNTICKSDMCIFKNIFVCLFVVVYVTGWFVSVWTKHTLFVDDYNLAFVDGDDEFVNLFASFRFHTIKVLQC